MTKCAITAPASANKKTQITITAVCLETIVLFYSAQWDLPLCLWFSISVQLITTCAVHDVSYRFLTLIRVLNDLSVHTLHHFACCWEQNQFNRQCLSVDGGWSLVSLTLVSHFQPFLHTTVSAWRKVWLLQFSFCYGFKTLWFVFISLN